MAWPLDVCPVPNSQQSPPGVCVPSIPPSAGSPGLGPCALPLTFSCLIASFVLGLNAEDPVATGGTEAHPFIRVPSA